MKNRKVFIIGASGFLGRNLLQLLPKKDLQVSGVYRAELQDWEKKVQAGSFSGSTVINCIAMTGLKECEANQEQAHETNAALPKKYAELCKKNGLGFVQIGTDSVFYNSESLNSPKYWKKDELGTFENYYSQSKVEAENELKKLNWGYCLRFSFVGASQGTHRGLISYLAKSLLKSPAEITGLVDNWFSPISVEFLVDQMNPDFFKKSQSGFLLEQWASSPALTKYDFLEKTAQAAGFQPKMIKRVRKEILGDVSAALDQSLAADVQESQSHLIQTAAKNLKEEIALLKGST